jgi:hypothetical protein
MSKAARLREQSARERIAAQQAAARRSERKRRAFLMGGSIFAVLAVVVALVITYQVRSTPSAASGKDVNGAALTASASTNLTSVPAATLAKIGGGSVLTFQNTYYAGAPVKPVSDTALTSGGKPEMLYIGAEYCPYCAAMRWSMAVALSKFGTFTTPLKGIHSSPTDIYPNTPSMTFYKTGYASNYLTFTPVENQTITKKSLQPTTSAQQALWVKYDSTSQGVGYPFIDFGNKAIITAPLFNPGLLAGKSWAQVAAALHDPSSPIALAVDGTANYMTAAICKMTNNAPAAVCTSPAISKLEAGI